MSFQYLRRLDKVLVPLTIRFYPVERTLHYIRKLVNQILIQYLKLTSRRHQPEILYQSNNYIVLNKPFDIKINSQDSRDYTVADNLYSAFPELVDESCVHHFRFTHRLDYPTSGVLCIALNQKAAGKVQKLFVQRRVKKHYIALVGGHLSEPYIFVDVPIGRDSSIIVKNKMCPCTSPSCINVKNATTLIILLEHGTYNGMPSSKVVMVPYTGRTHQLRVHCNLIGHTIIGDYTYSYEKDTEPYRMMLHAYSMNVPLAHEELNITSPDPFVPDVDSKWRPFKTFKTYADVCKEDLRLSTVQNKDICSLKFHVMNVNNSNEEML